jgi:hypothetical protein
MDVTNCVLSLSLYFEGSPPGEEPPGIIELSIK